MFTYIFTVTKIPVILFSQGLKIILNLIHNYTLTVANRLPEQVILVVIMIVENILLKTLSGN
jgi:hypothetical protein